MAPDISGDGDWPKYPRTPFSIPFQSQQPPRTPSSSSDDGMSGMSGMRLSPPALYGRRVDGLPRASEISGMISGMAERVWDFSEMAAEHMSDDDDDIFVKNHVTTPWNNMGDEHGVFVANRVPATPKESDGDDDDCVMIDAAEVSDEVRKKFVVKGKARSHFGQDAPDVQFMANFIKQEPGLGREFMPDEREESINVEGLASYADYLINQEKNGGFLYEVAGANQQPPVFQTNGGAIVIEEEPNRPPSDDEVVAIEQRAARSRQQTDPDADFKRLFRMTRKKKKLQQEKAAGRLSEDEEKALEILEGLIRTEEMKVNAQVIDLDDDDDDNSNSGSDSDYADPGTHGHDDAEDSMFVDDFPEIQALGRRNGAGSSSAPNASPTSSGRRGGPSKDKTRKPRQRAARTAREYWERVYKKRVENPRLASTAAKRQQLLNTADRNDGSNKRQKKQGPHLTGSDRLMNMLRDGDPVMARAALGDIPMPGAIQAKTKNQQIMQIKRNVQDNNNNKRGTAAGKAKSQMSLLIEAAKGFGLNRCKAQDGKWLLPGMKTGLFDHQLVGVHWMLGKEFSPQGPWGGILADQMGLGKTVQVLACMAQNPPTAEDGEARATLIVAPAAAIPQWLAEIKKHSNFAQKVFHYRASHRVTIEILQQRDIVIASYYEVAKAYPSEDALRRLSGMTLSEEDWRSQMDEHLGDLYRVQFRRIVLDEAHAIKNHQTRTSKACIHLPGKYRWALSGTPIHNNVEELYPYMRFLGTAWGMDLSEFKEHFGDLGEDTVKSRLAAVVPTLMMRRRVHDSFMGDPILRIPATHPIKTVMIDLSVEERLIYRRLEARFRDNLNTHARRAESGQVQKKMRTYFSYLTRLRQATAHPFLLETCMRTDFTLEDICWLRYQLAEIGGRTPLHKQIRRWMDVEEVRRERSEGDSQKQKDEENGAADKDKNAGCGSSGSGSSSDDQNGREKLPPAEEKFGKSGFGMIFNMTSQLMRIECEKQLSDVTCRVCYNIAELAEITECGHTFCIECLEGLVRAARARGKDTKCPTCGNMIKDSRSLRDNNDDDDGDGVESSAGRGSRPGGAPKPALAKGKGKGKGGKGKKAKAVKLGRPGDDMLGVQPKANETSKFLDYSDLFPDVPVTPSAKTTAIKKIVLDWQAEFPKDKIIIFTHWVPLARILGRVLSAESINFLYYFGSLEQGQKANAIAEFNKENTAAKVLIASIRCGGQALNLTAANRVILVDLWWNSAVERQAFGRVHRIGQTKETHYVKIVTRNTLDERMLDMQDDKDAEISETLQDNETDDPAPAEGRGKDKDKDKDKQWQQQQGGSQQQGQQQKGGKKKARLSATDFLYLVGAADKGEEVTGGALNHEDYYYSDEEDEEEDGDDGLGMIGHTASAAAGCGGVNGGGARECRSSTAEFASAPMLPLEVDDDDDDDDDEENTITVAPRNRGTVLPSIEGSHSGGSGPGGVGRVDRGDFEVDSLFGFEEEEGEDRPAEGAVPVTGEEEENFADGASGGVGVDNRNRMEVDDAVEQQQEEEEEQDDEDMFVSDI